VVEFFGTGRVETERALIGDHAVLFGQHQIGLAAGDLNLHPDVGFRDRIESEQGAPSSSSMANKMEKRARMSGFISVLRGLSGGLFGIAFGFSDLFFSGLARDFSLSADRR